MGTGPALFINDDPSQWLTLVSLGRRDSFADMITIRPRDRRGVGVSWLPCRICRGHRQALREAVEYNPKMCTTVGKEKENLTPAGTLHISRDNYHNAAPAAELSGTSLR